MPFLDEPGLQTFWNKLKAVFANKFQINHDIDNVQISLQNKDDGLLATGKILSATQESSGVMSIEDKAKLDGIAIGATDNVGTITEVSGLSPISGGGTEGSVVLTHDLSEASPGTYGDFVTTQRTPKFGESVKSIAIQTDACGHISAVSEHNVKIPDTRVNTVKDGLMSYEDKIKLNGIAENATSNSGTIEEITSTFPIVGSGTSGVVSLSHKESGVVPGTYHTLSTTPDYPKFGEAFYVPGFTVDETGHVTAAADYSVTIPADEATELKAGLLSPGDKFKLNHLPNWEDIQFDDRAVLGSVTLLNGVLELTFSHGETEMSATIDIKSYVDKAIERYLNSQSLSVEGSESEEFSYDED